MRVDVQPELLDWALHRAGLVPEELAARFPRLPDWQRGAAQPTLKQLEKFAGTVHVPIGFLFLSEPPEEKTPIPDFRTPGRAPLRSPSPDLLDTIYICQQRQEWFRDHAISSGESPVSFAGSVRAGASVEAVAAKIREALGLTAEERRTLPTWTDALRLLIEQAEAAGVLVMCSGVVLNQNRRRLDPAEFRGFTLADPWAPLIFINGADSKAAQMFTLVHELAHVWLGQSALGNEQLARPAGSDTERWCDEVAAEVLAPLAAVREVYRSGNDLATETDRLARHFKVSSLIALRRILDLGAISRPRFHQAYEDELARMGAVQRAGGGDFYLTQGARAGKRFARALVESTAEGRTLYRDALRLLGISKISTLQELGRSLGVAV